MAKKQSEKTSKTPKKTRKKKEKKTSRDFYPLVLVVWNDSFVSASWEVVDDTISNDIDNPATIMSVGFLIHDGDDCKIIAGSLYQHQTTNRMTIPNGCIIDIKRLGIDTNVEYNKMIKNGALTNGKK